MIGRLTGSIASDEATGNVVLDVGGVGYELSCPIGTLGRAQRAGPDGKRVTLFVHTNLRQDALELFGFCSHEERSTFRLLVSVPNVGPRLALSVLHVLPSEELARVIESEDKARLGKVPGVGKKTAERLVLELRGKLSPVLPGALDNATARPQATAAAGNERLVAALTGLGYRAAEAERAAKAISAEPGTPLAEQLREALKVLAP